MVNKAFVEQISRNIECYVDDMIVESLFKDHVDDMKKCLKTLRKYNVKINLSNCTLRV